MQVILAESAGFCYGVKRAVELAQKTAEEPQGCWMLGDLIHNTHVVNDLAARGVRKTDRPEALGAGDTVVIRSHGELKSVLDGLAARGVRCVNATCPNVVHIQELVSQAEQEGRQVVIIGEPHHPEVMGLASWCVHPLVFQGPEAVAEWVKNGDFQPEMPVSIVAQTTCIRELFESSCKILKKECTNVKIFDTICYATRKRQNEAAEIAAKVDVMVVVGDRKSANTKHLAEICRQNCSHVLSIEGADELSAARVIIATSTHMRQVPALQARVCAVAPGTPAIVGTPCGDGKFGPPEQSWAELCTLADYVLVEADGSRGLPLKAHLSHEPVLPQEAGQVIAVLGLTGLGRPIAEAAHRPERYAGLAGCAPEDVATPERAARVLEAEALHTRVLLNQADAADGTALLDRLHCPAVLASLRKGEIISCSF